MRSNPASRLAIPLLRDTPSREVEATEGQKQNGLSSDPPSLSIVVPTFQEAENLRLLITEIATTLDGVIPDWEVIIVDDDSQDGTADVCAALQRAGWPVKLVVRAHERGLSSAVVEGFAHARGAVLLVMDADLSHPARAIPELYHAVLEGAEFVIGSRYVPGGGTDDRWSTYRWLNSKVASWLARPLVALRDPTAGFFAFPRSLLQQCDGLNPIGYKIALEILVKSRAHHVREVPIQFRTRRFGKSKLKLKQQWLYLRHLWMLYRFRFFHAAPRPEGAESLLSQPPSQRIEKENVV